MRLSETTIRKRLTDFKKTPSGQLTIDAFNTIDLEEEQDPPCFTKGRQRQKQQQMDEINGLDKAGLAKELEQLRHEVESMLNKNKVYFDKERLSSLDVPVQVQPDSATTDPTINNDNSETVYLTNNGTDTSGLGSSLDTSTDASSANAETQPEHDTAVTNNEDVANEKDPVEGNKNQDGTADTENTECNEVVAEDVNKTSNKENVNDTVGKNNSTRRAAGAEIIRPWERG